MTRKYAIGSVVFAWIVLASFPEPSCADSWALPTTTTYKSCRGTARLIVVPRKLDSQLRYFEDKVAAVEPAGQQAGSPAFATARLERFENKRWQTVWQGPLANDVAPVAAIVRDDGEYAVTFDDWHLVGHGPHVVVIYGHGGHLVRALALSDIVPADYIEALPHTTSSIHWRGEPRFSADGQKAVMPIVIPSQAGSDDHKAVEFEVDLTDGKVSPIDPIAWTNALQDGEKVRAQLVAKATAEKAAFLAPLYGPAVNAQREWHAYLQEAVARLIGDDDFPSTTVLRMPDAKDYAISETWVREALTDSGADKVALASLSERNLVSVLARLTKKLPEGSLSGVTIFIAMSDQNWPEVAAAMGRSGAKLVQLDPSKAIKQRPDRIARRYADPTPLMEQPKPGRSANSAM